MAYSRLYTAIGFEDRPSRKSPMSAANLNKIEQGIVGLDDRIVEMSVREDDLEERLETVETEVVPIERGGTGGTTAKEAEYNILADMEESTDEMSDEYSQIVMKYAEPNSTKGVLVYRKATYLWNYIKSKAEAIFATKTEVTPIANLITTVAGKPLDAIMGKELNDRLTTLEESNGSGNSGIMVASPIDALFYTNPGMATTVSSVTIEPQSTKTIYLGFPASLSGLVTCENLVDIRNHVSNVIVLRWYIYHASCIAVTFFNPSTSETIGVASDDMDYWYKVE